MAKDKVEIDVEVKDKKGSTKKLALESKKAAKGLDDVGKGARTADRNLKGAAQASANGTKNFSKMAQGTGGLVGAYATLAANIFAVTAAFSFLRSSADFRVIQEAQVAFTGATGQGMRSLTSDIQEASDSMLNFQAASEAASIGIASGLSAAQINELASGASNLSKILGRDVTDSFNRLVRGVTKAEPELLDELGITLRLADAQENYASTLKKSAKDLSNFEKKQAVFAEVQSQLESKYNAVANATDIQANAMDKLAVAFDEVLHPIKSFVSMLSEPIAEFFSKNVKSFGIALALLAVPLLKQVIPGLDGFAEKAEESSRRASDAFKQTKIDIEALAQTRAAAGRDPIGAGKTALAGIKTKEGTGARAMQEGGVLTKRQLAAMKRAANKGVGIVKTMTKQQKASYLAAIEAMMHGDKKLGRSLKNTMTQILTTTKITAKRMQVVWQKTMSFMGKAASKMGKMVNGAMKALGFVGILFMLKDMAEMALRAMGVMKENEAVAAYAEKLEDLTSKLAETNKEFEKFAGMQEAMRQRFDKNGLLTHTVDRTREGIAAFGKMADQVTPKLLEMSELLKNPVDFNKGAAGLRFDAKEYHRQLKDLKDAGKSAFQAKQEINDTGLYGSKSNLIKAQHASGSDGLFTKLATEVPDSETALEEFNKTIDTTIAGIKAVGLASTDDGARYLELLEGAKANKGFTEKTAKEFALLGKEMGKTGGIASFLKMQQKELTKQFTSQMSAIQMFKTPQTDLLRLLNDQLETEKALVENEGKSKRIEELERQLDLTQKLHEITIGFKNESAKLAAVTAQAAIGATPMQKAEVQRVSKLMSVDIKRNEILSKMNLAKEGKLVLDEAQSEALTHQLALLNAQSEELERQNTLTLQLRDNMMAAMEGATTTGIADLIKGKEGSFKDTILKIAQTTLEAAADTLAKSLTSGIFGKIFETPAQKMERAHKEGGEAAAKMIKAALEGRLVGTSDIVGPGVAGAGGKKKPGLLSSIGNFILGEESNAQTVVEGLDGTRGQGTGDNHFREGGLAGLFKGFSANLGEIFSGDTPFLKGLGNIFTDGLDGFGDLFSGLFGGSKGAGGSTGIMESILGMFGLGARSGGVFSAGKKIQGYATGGIARGSTSGYPATLHGTEAVVPLPHGGKIPVEMKGEGSTNNNIVVNISTDGQSNKKGSSGPDMDKLGGAVAAAVQVELQNQKRSGGILNPYGVA